jgi:RNA binding exosome subunit
MGLLESQTQNKKKHEKSPNNPNFYMSLKKLNLKKEPIRVVPGIMIISIQIKMEDSKILQS